MQVNVQFLQQLQPEWSRFVTIVKQRYKLDEVSYHKVFDILKQYQKEVNELHAERLARNANPLALVATAQANQDPYYQTSKSHKSHAPSSKPSIPTRSHTTTRYTSKEIDKPITPPSETASEEDINPEQAQRDKDMRKNLALIAKTVNVVEDKENVGSLVVQQSGIQCFNCKEFGHFAKECRKPKRVKDSMYHKEKMLLCKQAEQGELEAQYSYMAKIQEVPIGDTCTDSEPLEQNDQNDIESDDECIALANLIANLKLDVDENKKIQKQLKKANTTLAQELKECKTILAKTSKTLGESNSVRDSCLVAIQNKQTEFQKYKAFNDRTIDYDKLERTLNEALGQLAQKDIEIKEEIVDNAWIKHLKDQFHAPTAQDMEILIQTCLMPLAIKTQNDSFLFIHELKQEMHADLKYVESLKKEIDELESDKAEFSNMYDMILQECVSKYVMCSYLLSLSDLDALDELQCLYLHKVKECDCLAQKLSNQTESVSKEVHSELLKFFAKVEKHSISFEIALQKRKEQAKENLWILSLINHLLLNAQRIPKPSVLGVNHNTNVSRPQHRSNQLKDKVLPNNSQVKPKKTQVEVHPGISSVSNKMKSVTTCKDSLNSKTLNANDVCTICNKCLVDSNHFACVTQMMNDVNARTKKPNTVQLILFIVDSGCTKHMTGNLKLLCNFVEKFMGTVRFGNDQFVPILRYGDLVQGNVTINRVYYVEGLNHNLFPVGQFCDADFEVAFWKSTCFVRDLQGKDLLTGNRGSDLYTISLQESTSSTPLCLMATASPTQAWLWHQRLSHLNFDYINLLSKKDVVIGLPKLKYVKDQLCSSCELSKAKRSSFKSKAVPSLKGRLNLLHMDYVDETPEVLKKFLMMIQRNLQALVITIRTDRGTKFLNKTLNAFFKEEGIEHQTSTARTPEQNGLVERQNRTLVEAARTMLSALKLPLFLWAEAIATTSYTQNRSIIIPTHDKMTYHIINDRKPSIKHLHIFCCTCYITKDGENLDKMKEKRDSCILVGYSTQSKGDRVYNKRTRMIVESIHIRFDEIKEVSETFVVNDNSGLVPQRQKTSDYDNSDPVPQIQNVSSSADAHVPSQQELDLLFGSLYDEFFNADSNPQDKQPTMNIQSTSAPSTPTYVHAEENNNDQAEEEHSPDDEFTNPFCAPA
nr:hypothetical protein [Tanacetum cinerariifolium]